MSESSSSIKELFQKLRNGGVRSTDLVKASLNQIAQVNGDLNALVRVHDKALAEAEKCDEDFKKGDAEGCLKGIPVVIKDNMAIAGREVGACSQVLKNYVSPYTATAVAKLQEQGAIIVGQSNMDEFAMGSSNENSSLGACKNPLDPTLAPGGSSGGSAAAVAAGMVPLALGSDTGGSIRQPAAFCGVVGLKPTYGRVSRYGLFAYASSLDQIGPLTRHVEDAALCLSVIEGADPMDMTSVQEPNPIQSIEDEPKKLKIGVPRQFMDTNRGLSHKMSQTLKDLFSKIESRGHEIREVDLPILEHVIPTYYLIANSEASSNLARYDSIRYGHRSTSSTSLMDSYCNSRNEGFGDEVKKRIFLGTYALSAGYYDAFYKKAEAIRQDMRNSLEDIFKNVDVLLGPTTPDPPFKLGDKVDDPMSMYMQDLYTTLANLTGSPAISVPCSKIDGFPSSVQIIGNLFDENRILQVARMVEKIRDGV